MDKYLSKRKVSLNACKNDIYLYCINESISIFRKKKTKLIKIVRTIFRKNACKESGNAFSRICE